MILNVLNVWAIQLALQFIHLMLCSSGGRVQLHPLFPFPPAVGTALKSLTRTMPVEKISRTTSWVERSRFANHIGHMWMSSLDWSLRPLILWNVHFLRWKSQLASPSHSIPISWWRNLQMHGFSRCSLLPMRLLFLIAWYVWWYFFNSESTLNGAPFHQKKASIIA